MAQHFCHSCALRGGHINPIMAGFANLTGSQYQLDKFIKHTAPWEYNGLISVYNAPEYDPYRNYIITASLSGCAQIDDQGRTNLIWYAGRHVGITYENGYYLLHNDAVKVVFHDNSIAIHSFPVNFESQYIKKCQICANPIFD